MAVEVEQLVVAARLADWPAQRVPQILLLHNRFRQPVLLIRPAVRVPVGVADHVVGRAAHPVGPTLRDGADLQPARAAVLGLIARGEHLAVVAGVHRGHAVHHDVVLAAAAEPAGRAAVLDLHTRREGGQSGEVAAHTDRQVLHRFGGDGEGPLAAL